jgi:NAD(P)-dependent dehydrogenase (short-subunit alcohol dehydrogenase family)
LKQTILITGASSGIGRATALYFFERGWNVAATMRSPEKAVDWPEDIFRVRLDVTQVDTIREAMERTRRRFVAIDAVVNNAGYGLAGPFEASRPEQVERQFATNVFGLMNVVREILPYFRERRTGTIVNVASIAGRMAIPLYSLYGGTKWAIEGFTESLQYELKPFNVRVKIVEPGPIKTGFYDRSMEVASQPGLTAYDGFAARAMANIHKAGETAPGPEKVARVIFKAVTDGSWRLRYQANAGAILFGRKLLPDRAFFAMVRAVVLR